MAEARAAPGTEAPPATFFGANKIVLLGQSRVGSTVRLLDGPRAGVELLVPNARLARGDAEIDDQRPPPLHRQRVTTEAAHRAESLLTGLLTPSQRQQRATTGTFWVHNAHGWFRLGALYDIRFRSPAWPSVERSVCVVSEGYALRPPADLWAELVVVLRADPRTVIDVANWNAEERPLAPATTRGALVRWLTAVQEEFRRRRRAGEDVHAAYLAFDTAWRLQRSVRPAWAPPFADRAADLLGQWADRWPDEADHLRRAHASVFTLADELTV